MYTSNVAFSNIFALLKIKHPIASVGLHPSDPLLEIYYVPFLSLTFQKSGSAPAIPIHIKFNLIGFYNIINLSSTVDSTVMLQAPS